MSTLRSAWRELLPALAAAVLSVSVLATPAGASYGEISHFGARGVGEAQFIQQAGTVAFGVDPTDNSLYIGDEPEKGEFRIQKLTATGTFIAEARFEPKGSEARPAGIEGIAVDAAEGRIYVLTVRERSELAEVDPSVPAASSLYAFKTQPNSEKKLEPAVGTTGLLAQLGGESKEISKVLLEPSGIAVDPTKHDVIVAGSEDRGAAEEPDLRGALERVSSAGKIDTHRWVDKAPEPLFEEGELTSPAVSASGKVYVLAGEHELEGGEHVEEVDEIPANFELNGAPKAVVKFNSGPGLEPLVTFPGLPLPSPGGGLSIDPKTGNFWVRASIEREVEPKHEIARGALEFDPQGKEIGWTGGEIWTKSSTAPCAISFIGHPIVAAGSESVFMLDTNPDAPKVIQFGPTGTGCPQASVSPPTALINGKPVVPPVKPNTEVTFSSKVTQANALKVEWNFGDGTTETVSKNEYQTIATAHTFTKEGTFTITETVYTDNLATPTQTKTTKLTVEVPRPVAAFNWPENPLNVGEAWEFNGTGSTDPNGPSALPLEYAWSFGDGASSTAPVVSHGYAASGEYTASLTVTDQLHLKTTVTHTIKVGAPGVGGGGLGGGGGGGETGGGGGSNGTSTTPPAPTPGGSAAVLPYMVRVASSSLAVSRSGALPIKVDCAGRSACTGSVTLRTLSAVSAGGKRKTILTLASGSFTLAGGQVKVLTLHLSTKARQLLKRSHVLRARATIVARDSSGVAHTTATLVTLRASKH